MQEQSQLFHDGAFLLPSKSMGIKFLCPNGHKMNVKAFLAGKRGKCPKCGASVRIPREAPASDSGEDLLGDVAESAGTPEPVAVRTGAAVAEAVRPPLPVGAPAIPFVSVKSSGQPAGPVAVPGPQKVPVSLPAGSDPISQAPHSIWYVRPPSGGQFGPARGGIMQKWVAEGRVSGDSLVWREGFPEWKPAAEIFPALAGVETPATPAAGPPPPPKETAGSPKLTPAVRKLNAYQARKSQGNGMAIAILIVLGVICVALVIGLAVVLSQGTHKGAPKKSAAVAGQKR